MQFSKAGYLAETATVAVIDDSSVSRDAKLTPIAVERAIDAAVGGTVTAANAKAHVVLPANGLVVSGTTSAASGSVSIGFGVVNPAVDPASLPGRYRAQASDGASVMFEAFGAMRVDLADSTGRAVNLASGKTAEIRIPVAPRATALPSSVGLFSFDPASGIWKQEGSAFLGGTEPNQYYHGEVSHFSWWAAALPVEVVSVLGCVESGVGTRVAGAQVFSVAVDHWMLDEGVTDAKGEFVLWVKRDGVTRLAAIAGNQVGNSMSIGPILNELRLPACISLTRDAAAPVVYQDPMPFYALENGPALFSVGANGTPLMSYQWQRDGKDIPGAVSRVLVLPTATTADDQASFRVVVRNNAGATTSNAARLTVSTGPALAPVINGHPLSATGVVGGAVQFAVSAESYGGTLSYQWRRNGVNITPEGRNAVLTLSNLQLAHDGAIFDVLVSSSNGKAVVSQPATLSVLAEPIVISRQPVSTSVGIGEAASFSVGAIGAGKLSYQWRRNGVDIAGATNPTYVTAKTSAADSGAVFTVVIRNSSGQSLTSASVTLTVTTQQPSGSRWLPGRAGLASSGSVTWADGAEVLESGALVVVDPKNPTSVLTLAAAGRHRLATVFPEAQVSDGGTVLRNGSDRYITYFAPDGRLYRSDLHTSDPRVVSQVSTLTSQTVCGRYSYGEQLFDVADVSRSWIYFPTPGGDGKCLPEDDNTRWVAVRLGMTASDAPVQLDGRILFGLWDPVTHSLTGAIAKSGAQIVRLNADLQSPVVLFTVDEATFSSYEFAGSVWVFRDGQKLWGLDTAAARGSKVEIATLTAGEVSTDSVLAEGDATTNFVVINNGSYARVLKLNSALQATALTPTPGQVQQLLMTPTRLVAHGSRSGLWSLPKGGAASWTHLSVPGPFGVTSYGAVVVVGETVWTDSPYSTAYSSVEWIRSDNSARQTLAGGAELWGALSSGAMSLS
ncbi:hypothetical protein CATMQ487_16180 [Sphaerotilus microaerophilus]|uniref:Ig-like domain-containing protein n=1 Tax=Sphaerotilus microaerophilus TaxID=2914710 RepID=A0ABM7YJZ8_9BURK|nr:hypothetical protein CATMQ487_16180 [Sphaerotilus sp. FB-5]